MYLQPHAVHRKGNSAPYELANSVTYAYLDGRRHRRAGADAHEHTLLSSHQSRSSDGLVRVDLHDLVDQRGVAVLGDEARADTLDLVGAGGATAEHGGLHRLNGHEVQVGVLGAQELACNKK
jgi:hypothetical protein